MFKNRILFALVWSLLLVDPLFADPITGIISLAMAAIKASTVLTAIVKLVIGIALNIGISLLQKAMNKTKPSGIKAEISAGETTFMSFIMGSYATPGHLEYVNTYGNAGKTPNAVLCQVISLSDIPIDGIENTVWVNDKLCNRNTTLTPTTLGYFGTGSHPFTEYVEKGKHHLFAKYYLGTQTTADPNLVSTFGSDALKPWVSDMIGRGIPYIILTALINSKLFSSIPTTRWIVRGIKLYDPRKDTTVGGSGSHRWNTPSTWEFSNNPVVMIYNILRGIYYEGKLIWGGNIPAVRLPVANWFAAMNVCDTLVYRNNVQMAQFQAGIEISTGDDDPATVIEELLKACGGRMSEIGGVYKIKVGAPSAAVMSITDAHIVVSEAQSYSPFPRSDSVFNGVVATYPEPTAAWQMKEAPSISYSALVTEDGAEQKADVQFNAVSNVYQVEQLANKLVLDNRRFLRHKLVLPPEAWVLEPLDIISWTSTYNGYTSKLFLIEECEDDENILQAVSLIEVDPADDAWSDGNHITPTIVTPIWVAPVSQSMSGWQVNAYDIVDDLDNSRRPSISVTFAGDMDDVRAVQVTVRLQSSGDVVFDGEIPYGDILDAGLTKTVGLNGVFLPATQYEVSGKFIPYSSRSTDFSAWISVTTNNVLISDVVVDLDHLAGDAYGSLLETSTLLNTLKSGLETLAALVAEGQGWQYQNRRVDMAYSGSLASAMDTLAARVTVTEEGIVSEALIREAATASIPSLENIAGGTSEAVTILNATVSSLDDEITAMATSLSTVQAQTDTGTASGLIGWVTQSAPGGVSARFALEGRVNSGSGWEVGGAYFDIISGGGSRWSFLSNAFFILKPDGSPVAAFGTAGADVLVNTALIKNLTATNITAGSITSSLLAADVGTFVDLRVSTATFDFAQIENVVINEGVIAAGAVTASSSQNITASQPQSGITIWNDSVSITISSPSGNPILLYVGIVLTGTITNGTVGGKARVLLDGVVLSSVPTLSGYPGPGSLNINYSNLLMVAVAVGSHTIKIQTSIDVTLSGQAFNGSLIGTCNKK